MLLMSVELNGVLLFNILVYTSPTPPHTQQKKKKAETTSFRLFFLSPIVMHRQANKCEHKAKALHTFKYFFLWYLLNDHVSLLLSE